MERKGVGHPDTMCDAIAERASQYYSQYCMEHFGRVAHHWFDKVMLLGGDADVMYGKGTMVKPYQVVFAGKGHTHTAMSPFLLKDSFRCGKGCVIRGDNRI